MENDFVYTVFRGAYLIALRMYLRLLPSYTEGNDRDGLLQTSCSNIVSQLFWHRRKQAGFRVIKSIFKPVACNGVQQ
jgi:hypothetical protein